MARIAIGGFGHETNSFIPDRADFRYFATHRDRPPLVRGADIFTWLAEGSFPITAVIDELQGAHELVPLVWAHGSAGGIVTTEAFERIVSELVGRLSEAMPVDAVYLDLHGAMVSEAFEDAEGELLRRVRAAVGDAVPVVVSLDYHANVTPEMVEHSDGFVIFLTYPHVDRPQTGVRASQVLLELLRRGRPRGRALRKPSFLIPITAQCTLVEPSQGIVAGSRLLDGDILSVAYAAGFPPSDLYWCGPAVVVHAFTQEAADRAADLLEARLVAAEAAFDVPLLSVREGVGQALAIASRGNLPVVIADVQDNPGGGGSANTTDIVKELVAAGAGNTVVGILCDPDAAEAAHRAGEGARLDLALGGSSGPEGVTPLRGSFTVQRLGSGSFRATGDVARGADVALGPMALLRIGGVEVVVSSRRMQAFDRAPFEHLGVDLPSRRIIVVKSSVHFRAEFEPLAEEVLLIAAPGLVPESNIDLPYRRLRDGLRLRPLGKAFSQPHQAEGPGAA